MNLQNRYFVTVLILPFFYLLNSNDLMKEGDNEETDSLKFNLPPQISYEYEIDENNENISELGTGVDKVISKKESVDKISLTFFSFQESDRYTGNFVINSFNSKGGYTQKSENSSWHSVDSTPFQKALLAFQGSIFKVDLNEEGKIKSILGQEDFQNVFSNLYLSELNKIEIEGNRPAFSADNTMVFTASYFTDLFEKITNNIPTGQLLKYNQWQKIESKDFGGNKDVVTLYTINKIQDGVAFISSFAKFDELLPTKDSDKSMRILGVEEGIIELDCNTGMLIKSEKKLSLQAKTRVGNLDYSTSRSRNINISLRNKRNCIGFNDVVFSGEGNLVKQVFLDGSISCIEIVYDFYKIADQLIVTDQDGKQLALVKTSSTSGDRAILIPTKSVTLLTLKISSDTPTSRWTVTLRKKKV